MDISHPRQVLSRHRVEAGGLALSFARENTSRGVDWGFEEPHHTLVVHLDGALSRMETAFTSGPSASLVPEIGDVWVIPAGCRYAAYARGGEVAFAEFSVSAGLLGDLVAPRAAHRDPFLHQLALRARGLALREDDMSRMLLQSIGETAALHLADAYGRGASGEKPVAGLGAMARRRVIDFIDGHLADDLSIADLAAVCGLAENAFLAAFRASLGVTPWQFVLRRRLAHARTLLATTGLPITTIALAAGFATPSHFTAHFRRHTGATPRAYRQALRASASVVAPPA